MGGSCPDIVFPTLEQIVQVNRRMIELWGGSFSPPNNFHNRSSLEYILSAIAFTIYGHVLYTTLEEKAVALGYEIITTHVFLDGNKRTGIYMTWSFLMTNGRNMGLDMSIVRLTEGMANGDNSREDFLRWVQNRL